MLVGTRGWGSWRSHNWALTHPHEQTRRKIKGRQPQTPAAEARLLLGAKEDKQAQKGSRTRAGYCCPNSWGKRQENTVFVRISFKERVTHVRDSLRW